MRDTLQYSDNGLMNRMIFLSTSNEINVIVEDVGKEYEYEQIFDRLFDGKIVVNHIFPMNGKPGVIKAFNQYGATYKDKKVFYIVDGDFDEIMEKKEIDDPQFIYLKDYNIEDYYIDKKAIIKYVSGRIKKSMSDVNTLVDFDLWENESFSVLIDLFICFIVIQKTDPTYPNVNENSEYYYVDSDTGLFSKKKISDYIEDVKKRCPDYDVLNRQFKLEFSSKLSADPYRIICGKYLLAGLVQYLRKKTSKSYKIDDFKNFLINTFDIQKLFYVKDQIMNNLNLSA